MKRFHQISNWGMWLFLSITMAGYLMLNYGYSNLAFHIPGISMGIPVGHLLACTALAFTIWRFRGWEQVKHFLQEPIFLAWLGLLALTFAHLMFNIRQYGGYAIRDSSFVIEGGFLLLGYLLAQKESAQNNFLRLLFWVFLAAFIYSLTVLRLDIITKYSPVSGIFQSVPVFGQYSFIPFGLQIGALFYIILAARIIRCPSYILWMLAIFQISMMFFFQARSTYVTAILVILLAIIFDGIRQGIRISTLHMAGFALLILIASVPRPQGNEIQGRMGEVDPAFYVEHIETIDPNKNLPNVSGTSWRLGIWQEAINRWLASPATILVGEGFGQPLTSYRQVGGYTGLAVKETSVKPGEFSVAIRQPHNIHLTILARLGLIGLILWAIINARLLWLFIRSLWRQKRDASDHAITLWLLLFYMSGILLATLQPWLEFSYGAIPFYIITGFALEILNAQNTKQNAPLSPKAL